jgi:hypothetical protein
VRKDVTSRKAKPNLNPTSAALPKMVKLRDSPLRFLPWRRSPVNHIIMPRIIRRPIPRLDP